MGRTRAARNPAGRHRPETTRTLRSFSGRGGRNIPRQFRRFKPARLSGIRFPVTSTPHILLVEDDREISQLVARYLRGNDLRVSVAGDGREMDRLMADSRVDLLVLDLMLPGEDGLSICRRLRAQSTVPILMLTAKGEEIDRIVGLELGADDYLAKPFNPRELLARIRAVLRRGGNGAAVRDDDAARRMSFGGFVLDAGLRQLLNPDGAQVALTAAEFDLLHAMCLRPGRVLSRDQLLDLTQGRAPGPFERSIDVLVSRIRQKIERDPRNPEMIKTIRSGGYVFTPEVTRP
jgi:two-component system, OmpR family, response regulator